MGAIAVYFARLSSIQHSDLIAFIAPTEAGGAAAIPLIRSERRNLQASVLRGSHHVLPRTWNGAGRLA
jgi:hypothetical protein